MSKPRNKFGQWIKSKRPTKGKPIRLTDEEEKIIKDHRKKESELE